MEYKQPIIAITHGDISGISYELLLKTFAREEILSLLTPIIYGSAKAEAFWRNHLAMEALPWVQISHARQAKPEQVNFIDCDQDDQPLSLTPGEAHPQSGLLALEALERAVRDVQDGLCTALVTAPITKGTMPSDRFPFAGHTEYLQHKDKVADRRALMILTAGEVRVALATTHIPLQAVASSLSTNLIVERTKQLDQALRRDFCIIKPRIAILGLNPHAGEGGKLGKEEETILRPALQQLDEEGILAFGPYPSDGFWGSDLIDRFDGILALYHDQGLAPFKALYMDRGVNVTAGLSFVRTSPDHGTAYGIAGRGSASCESLREAIYQAIDIARQRKRYERATRNPLRRTFVTDRREEDRHEPHLPA